MKKRKPGRPPLPEGEKTGNNPVRQVGRWDDHSWGIVRAAAARAGTSVAGWARAVMLAAARK